MANAHVALPVRVSGVSWYSDAHVLGVELHHGDVVFDRPNSCGACSVLVSRSIRGERYVMFACCGGQLVGSDEVVRVAAPRLLPSGLLDAPARHPSCRCRWSE